jgi:predicted esterase
MKKSLLILILISFGFELSIAQQYTAITYYKDDTVKLDLDLFIPKKADPGKLPLVIFVHGGGFATGNRKDGHNFCQFLANHGIASATISYTLYMKGKNFSCDGVLSEKIKAIRLAVNDLWLATSYFVENMDKYNIDTSKIFIAGSSAGGETVLHAAFWDYKTMNVFNKKLLDSFKYAGLISGAGAIMDLNLINEKNKIPILMFHGNADLLVPYGTAAHHYCKPSAPGWLMLFGSHSIYNHLIGLNGSVKLYTFCGGGHEYSGELFKSTKQEPILDFIEDVLLGKKFQNHNIIPTGKKTDKSSAYKFCD